MALKLLTRKDAQLENAELGIKLKLGRLLPEHISEIRGLLCESKAPDQAVAIYTLRHCASELEVEGEQHSPRQLSYQIDPSDDDNAVFLLGVTSLVIEELLVSDDAKKKRSTPPAPTGATSGA